MVVFLYTGMGAIYLIDPSIAYPRSQNDIPVHFPNPFSPGDIYQIQMHSQMVKHCDG